MSGEDAPRPCLENLIVLEIKTNKQSYNQVIYYERPPAGKTRVRGHELTLVRMHVRYTCGHYLITLASQRRDVQDAKEEVTCSQVRAFSVLERELSRNGVLIVAKAGGAHLADRMRKNLERFGGAQGTGHTRFLLWLVQKASP
jgi:hypothetical protein